MALTMRLAAAGELMGVAVIDHLVLGDGRYCSLKELGCVLMAKILYFDCFAGASGDMILGALIDAGLPLEALEAALGQPDDPRLSADRRPRAALRSVGDQVPRARAGCGRRPTIMRHDDGHEHRAHAHEHAHDGARARPRTRGRPPARAPAANRADAHAHRSLAEINDLIDGSALSPGGAGAGDRAVPAAGRGRGGDSPDAGRAGAPARGRRPRLDHRHRRARSSAMEWFGADRVVASPLNVGGGMVQVRARRVPGAGAGHGAAAGRRARSTRAACRWRP